MITFLYFISPLFIQGVILMAEASELKVGSYFMHKGDILRVTKKEVVVFGTHSHSKLKIFARDLFGSGEKVMNFAHSDRVDLLDIVRKTAQVIAKNDHDVQIMDTVSYDTHDVTLQEDLASSIHEGDEVIFIEHNEGVHVIEKK